MTKQVFINLAVSDLQKSADFYTALGIEPNEMRDHGFMVQRTIEDFDGHTWEIFFMDLSKFPSQPAE